MKLKSRSEDLLEELLKKGVVRTIPNIDFIETYKERIEKKNKTYRETKEKEEERISAIQCPSCKSTDKKHIVKRNNNSIVGPGYSSWIVEEHFECNECGTMYKDIFKIKNNETS